jgi:septum formation protein
MLVLASKSPRRKQLTSEKITTDFLTYSPEIDESISYSLSPLEAVRDIAKRKALSSQQHFKNDIIISADTIVVLDNEILGKPKDEEDAKRILKLLSNKTHEVITAYCIINKEKLIMNHVISKVTFLPITEKTIDEYVKSKSPLDKAGAYGIQDNDKYHFIKDYEGSYENIVGFPTKEIIQDLENIKK